MQPGGEQAILGIQRLVATGRGFDQDDACAEVRFVIQHIHQPIDEAAQKVAAAELHDALGLARRIAIGFAQEICHLLLQPLPVRTERVANPSPSPSPTSQGG